MAQTGILDYQRYLNTLQTLNDLGQTFPSNQQTYNFTVAGGGTASWPATIRWETLVVDKVSFSSQATGYIPNVDDSQVVGYFDGGSTTQYSTGVISIPAGMYAGPILPGGDYHVPITIVHLEWFDGTTTYAQQIGFIQNWEPGVEIADPTTDFEYHPVYAIPSTLTLTGDTGVVFGDNLILTATTDMATDLGVNATRVRFYRESTGTDIVLGTSYFSGTSAQLVVPTDPTLPIGTYNIYAISQARGPYATATSNTLNVRVESGVPLIVTTSTFTPSKAYYYPGDSVRYDLGVVQDPGFTATGVAIANPISIKLIDAFTPFTETNILNSNFVNGQTSANFNVVSSMIDLSRQYPQTQWSITTSTQNATQYTATLFVYNTETVQSNWGYQTAGRYRAGSTSTSINVGTSTQVTVTGQAFPLTITQTSTSTYYDEEFSITVGTTTATYYTDISIVATLGSTSTTLYSGNNSGTSSFTVNNLLISTTGTWTITASYPGDLGMSIVNANLPSTSNSLSHIVRLGQDLLPTPIVTTQRTGSNDIITITASTSTTLVNTLTYWYGATSLGTSSWVRYNIVEATTVTTVLYTGTTDISYYANGGLERNYDKTYTSLKNYSLALGWSAAEGPYFDELRPNPYYGIPIRANGLRLFKYYDGSNYDLSQVTGTNYDEILDPIQYGTTWTTEFLNTLTVVANQSNLMNCIAKPSYNFDGYGNNWWYSSADQVQVDVYDTYKIDLIGDTRGYNVIGLDALRYSGPLDMTVGNPRRLFFKALPLRGKVRYIDLVEYIGEVEWQKPYENAAQKAGTEPRTKFKVKLFKFTPTIPQAQREFKNTYTNLTQGDGEPLNLPVPVTTTTYNAYGLGTQVSFSGRRITKFSTTVGGLKFANRFNGLDPLSIPPNNLYTRREPQDYIQDYFNTSAPFSMINERWMYQNLPSPQYLNYLFAQDNNRYNAYGKKTWTSTNPGNAEADDLAQFYMDWAITFGGRGISFYPNDSMISFDPITTTSTTYTYTPTDIQIGTLTLPLDTLPDSTGVHVTWPGTLGLPVEYGRYNSFDIYTTSSPRVISITANNVSIPSANSGDTYLTETLFPTTRVYPTNPVRLQATIQGSQYQFDGSSAINTGTVEFINHDTGVVIATANITNSLATIYVYAQDLTSTTVATTSTSGTNVIVSSRVVGFPQEEINTLNLQVFNYAGVTYLPIDENFTATNYSSAPSYTITNTPVNPPYPKQGIPTTVVKTFSRDPNYINFICLNGTIEIIAPYFVKGKDGYYNLNNYFPIYPNVSSLYVTVSSRSFGSWPGGLFPLGYNDAMVTMTNSNVPGTYKNQAGWSGRYKLTASSNQDKPNIFTLTFSEKLLWLERLNWQNPAAEVNYVDGVWGKYQVLGDNIWTTCDIRISVEAYDDLNNLVATIPANCFLGYKENLSIKNMQGFQPPNIYEFI